MEGRTPLTLRAVRSVFRLVGEARELGADPGRWRPHMVESLARILNAEVVVSSEIHVRADDRAGSLRILDFGWGFDQGRQLWRIETERQETSLDSYWLAVQPQEQREARGRDAIVPIHPARKVYGGTKFILSQFPLYHIGAVDQLGVHRAWGHQPFTPADHRLLRLLHLELGRLWTQDILRRASDPTSDLPPRLAQTLAALRAGRSEKEVSIELGISRHTVHNYVKALHQRLGVSSRGELLAKASESESTFVPKLSVHLPPRPGASAGSR